MALLIVAAFYLLITIWIWIKPKEEDGSHIEFYVTLPNGEKKLIRRYEMKFNQKVKVSLAIKSADGKPAKVDGLPVWTVSNPDAVEMTVADDGLSADFKSKEVEDLLNSISVEADADRGEGVRKIVGVAALPVVGPDAEVLELSVGEAEDV